MTNNTLDKITVSEKVQFTSPKKQIVNDPYVEWEVHQHLLAGKKQIYSNFAACDLDS